MHTSYIIGFGVLGDLLALKRVKNARSAFLLVFSHHETKQIYATTCLLGWMGRGVGMGCRCNHLQRFVGFVGCMLPSKTWNQRSSLYFPNVCSHYTQMIRGFSLRSSSPKIFPKMGWSRPQRFWTRFTWYFVAFEYVESWCISSQVW